MQRLKPESINLHITELTHYRIIKLSNRKSLPCKLLNNVVTSFLVGFKICFQKVGKKEKL